MPIPRKLNHHFFKTWSPEMAYVLGYFAADGSMIRNNRGSHFIEFTSTDCVLINIVKEAVDSNHAVSIRNRGGNYAPAYRIQFGSKEWFQDLTQLGFRQNKSNVLELPGLPSAYIGDFVRGYFDGDGCVYFNNTYRSDRDCIQPTLTTLFTSGSIRFLTSLRQLLRKHGLSGGALKKKERGFELVFSRYDSLALHRLMYHTGEISTQFLPRKREKLERGIKALGLD